MGLGCVLAVSCFLGIDVFLQEFIVSSSLGVH